MDFAEYREQRQAELDVKRAEAQRLAEAAKLPPPEPKAKKRSDSFWDHFFYGI